MNYTVHIDVDGASTVAEVLESVEGLGVGDVRISTESPTFEEMVEQSSLPDFEFHGGDEITPEAGQRWFDPHNKQEWGGGHVEIVEQANEPADSYIIESPVPGRSHRTVYEANSHVSVVSPDDEVVMASYEDSDSVYAFPESRLIPVCPTCGPIERDDVRHSAENPGFECTCTHALYD